MHVVCVLEMSFPPQIHTAYDDENSEIFNSRGIAVSKIQFHNEIDFSQGIDSVESMSGVLKNLKSRALNIILLPGNNTNLTVQRTLLKSIEVEK
jgi:hypothetical protein